MTCEGCGREVGDLKALKAHRKTCEKYRTWSAKAASPTLSPPPVHHVYEGRVIPTILG